MRSRTAWKDKLLKPVHPEVVFVDKPMPFAPGARSMLIPTPMQIFEMLKQIPAGQLLTLTELRNRLRVGYETDTTCPLTTGIFLRIVAEATEEAAQTQAHELQAPWWRVVKEDGSLNPKLPGAGALQAQRLEAEGIPLRAPRKTGGLPKVHLAALPLADVTPS